MATDQEEIARLRAELAAKGEPVMERIDIPKLSLTPVEGEVTGGKSVYLLIRDQAFECRRVSVSWHMMKFARAQRKAQVNIPKGMPDGPMRKELEEKRNAAGLDMMAIMLDTVECLLKPDERARFESYMDEASASDGGLNAGELEEAIGAVIAAVGGNEEGKAEASSPSLDSGQTTSEPARVISLSKAMREGVSPEKI